MSVTSEISGAPAPSASAGQVTPPAECDALPCGAGDQANLRREILSAIRAETEPSKLPPAWEFLGPSSSFRRLRRTSLELAALLRQTFSLEQLLAAHVFEQNRDNEPTLNPVFGDMTSQLRFVREGDPAVENIISERRGLSFKEPSSVHFACAGYGVAANQEAKRLLVAASDADVLVLQSLGFSCTWAAGLERLSVKQVRRIFAPANSKKSGYKFKVTIVGWQPSLLDTRLPQLIEEVLARLADVEQAYEIDPATRFDVSLLKPPEIVALRLAAKFRDKKAAQKTVTESLKSSTYSPADARDATAKPVEPDYAAARANLHRAIGRSRMLPGSQDVGDALEKFKLAFQKTVGQKYHKAAATADDPIESTLLLMADEIGTQWFESQETMTMAQQAIAKRIPEHLSTIDPDRLDERLRLANTLLKIRKSLL